MKWFVLIAPMLGTLFSFGILLVQHFTPPDDGTLVGRTEPELIAKYGPPTSQFAGHYGSPTLAFRRQFSTDVKTDVFAIHSGEIYVSFERQQGTWVCICNNWLPAGGAF